MYIPAQSMPCNKVEPKKVKRFIIKTMNSNGIPWDYELREFMRKHEVDVNKVKRLYVAFKEGKRRKLKRLRIVREVYTACECCGPQVSIKGTVGAVKFG